MLSIRSPSIFIGSLCAFLLAACLPLLAAAVTSPSSRTVGNPANAVTLEGYVEKAGQTVTIQAVDQNTGALVTLGMTTAAMSGTSYTTPSGTHYTAYPWTFKAGVLALNYWAPQTVVTDVATSQGHLELFALAGGQYFDTFSAAARASAVASNQDPQTAAANFSDGKSTVLFDPNGVGSGPETAWVTVAGMISDSHSPYYSPVAWSVGYYTVENGMKIYALVCSPPSGGPYPVVIFNHGGTGSGDGGNLNGVVTPAGWTVQPVVLGPNGQPVLGPNGLPIPLPDSLGQCLDWAKRGWVFATPTYRSESVNITSSSPQFSPPATPWISDGKVEFCMGEVTDVMALTDLLVNHTSSVTLGNPSQKVEINVNGQVLMYGYSHGGCMTYRAVEQGAPVTAFSVIEGFTDFPLNYLNWTSNNQSQQNAAIAAGAYQPGVATSVYLPDAAHVMGYNWRSAHYFASRGDLSIRKFKTMPILILQGDVDADNPVFLGRAGRDCGRHRSDQHLRRAQWLGSAEQRALHLRPGGGADPGFDDGAECGVPDLVHAAGHRRFMRDRRRAGADVAVQSRDDTVDAAAAPLLGRLPQYEPHQRRARVQGNVQPLCREVLQETTRLRRPAIQLQLGLTPPETGAAQDQSTGRYHRPYRL